MTKKRIFPIIGGAFFLYFLSTGISFAVFSYFGQEKGTTLTSPVPEELKKEGFKVDINAPKTEECPLNGKFYTKAEREIWQKRRPLAVMIENHKEARPQSGLSRADIVYEVVAEGGITRFLAIFYCGAAAKNLEMAPVRSARTYFLDWVSEYDALYNHVGGAGRCNDPTVDERAKALCQIGTYGIKDLDQFGISFPDCYRNPDRLDRPVATEHQMVCLSDNLYEIAKKRGWTDVDEKGIAWNKNFTPWQFKDEAKLADRPASFSAEFNFWKGYKDYLVRWEYDQKTNSYFRFNGGQPHHDQKEGQFQAKNIVIQFVKEEGPVDEHLHLLYQTKGEGKALVFQDGKVVQATWRKKDRLSRTKFYDQQQREIKFNRGEIWIEMLPTGAKVDY